MKLLTTACLLALMATPLGAWAGDAKTNSSSVQAETASVDFGQTPPKSLAPKAEINVITEPTVRYHVIEFIKGSSYTITIIEGKDEIVLVDVGPDFGYGFDAELRAYADALNKPMSIVITHDHPDHFTGLGKFQDIDVYAETKVAGLLSANKDFKSYYSAPIKVVSGTQVLAGFSFEMSSLSNMEAEETAVIAIPSLKAVFTGDLIDNNAHGFVRAYTPLDSIDEINLWRTGLQGLKAKYGNYKHVFFGHYGSSSDIGGVIDGTIDYLNTAQALIKGTQTLKSGKKAASVEDVVNELELLYPNLKSGALKLSLPGAFFDGDPGAVWF